MIAALEGLPNPPREQGWCDGWLGLPQASSDPAYLDGYWAGIAEAQAAPAGCTLIAKEPTS